MKLQTSITSNSIKIIDLYNKISSGSLVTSPDFQRKLVWKKQHKFAFINTILSNFPFPEVYIASSEVNVESLQAREIVVDGQQRLTTIIDYIKGAEYFKNQNQVVVFDELSIDEKREFLNYSVTVKDLKDIGMDNIKEVFKRINSTDYSLNANEVINAQYGDGEFSMFCKQLIEKDFLPTIEKTDIIIPFEFKNRVCDFFNNNHIFSENDIKRMFDIQYIMLVSATILEGEYFGRSSRINFYLEKYNASFDLFSEIITYIVKSLDIINELKLSANSYWYNKANLFTLLIEFGKIDLKQIDLKLLELKLLELEKKVDIYFTDEDISMITDDERKYFEFARQGSHELSARQHRGKLIRKIIEESSPKATIIEEKSIEKNNLDAIQNLGIKFSILIPTETGLNKSIMDAVSSVRVFLKENSIHDFESQEFGPDHKIKLNGVLILDTKEIPTEISLYRSNGRGDYRIWFSNLVELASANDKLLLLIKDKVINVLNISKYDYSGILNSLL